MTDQVKTNSVNSERLSVVALFSGGASGVRYLLEKSRQDANYRITAGLADSEDCSGINTLDQHGVPVEVVKKRDLNNGESDSRYFGRVAESVKEYDPDLILLSGFMKIVKEPLLSRFEDQIINVHPADLRIEENGKRKYRGTDTVRRTISSGAREIRSTVHLVTRGVDEGPILVVSEPVRINRRLVRTFEEFDRDMVRSYADILQEWMKWACDGPAIKRAIELIATGKVNIDGNDVSFEGKNPSKSSYYDLEKEDFVPLRA